MGCENTHPSELKASKQQQYTKQKVHKWCRRRPYMQHHATARRSDSFLYGSADPPARVSWPSSGDANQQEKAPAERSNNNKKTEVHTQKRGLNRLCEEIKSGANQTCISECTSKYCKSTNKFDFFYKHGKQTKIPENLWFLFHSNLISQNSLNSVLK